MIKKVITWGGIAFLLFFIAYRPDTAGEVFQSLGSTVSGIASGIKDFFADLVG